MKRIPWQKVLGVLLIAWGCFMWGYQKGRADEAAINRKEGWKAVESVAKMAAQAKIDGYKQAKKEDQEMLEVAGTQAALSRVPGVAGGK